MARSRVRLTERSIAGIKHAERATIEEAKGGFAVTVANKYGEARLRTGGGDAVYPTVASARKVIHCHNSGIPIAKVIAPPVSMRPRKVVQPPEALRKPPEGE
jgi:hypothetical protein